MREVYIEDPKRLQNLLMRTTSAQFGEYGWARLEMDTGEILEVVEDEGTINWIYYEEERN